MALGDFHEIVWLTKGLASTRTHIHRAYQRSGCFFTLCGAEVPREAITGPKLDDKRCTFCELEAGRVSRPPSGTPTPDDLQRALADLKSRTKAAQGVTR